MPPFRGVPGPYSYNLRLHQDSWAPVLRPLHATRSWLTPAATDVAGDDVHPPVGGFWPRGPGGRGEPPDLRHVLGLGVASSDVPASACGTLFGAVSPSSRGLAFREVHAASRATVSYYAAAASPDNVGCHICASR